MKRILNLWLLAALVCGLGLSVTSCKDDDDDNNKTEEQKEQEQQQLQTKFWSVVSQLVSTDDYTEDYADKTFEPTIGTPESEGSLTRLVATNDMQTAAQRFADLVGASGIDENTPSYTYSDPEVGTLTYTRGGTAEEWATVDVSIKQVPKLRKIIYRQGGEGTNASFTGKAYYRFGDVVARTYMGSIEYWICVRPAFGPEKKGDSHWVCLNPQKEFKYYKASDGREYWLPSGLGVNKEHMQNLAEMLYAICYPEQWYNNANNYHTDGKLWGFSGLPIFTDFSKAKLQYHNQYFWQRVQQGWEAKGIADKAMNIDLGALADVINRDGINLLYNGYSWWFLSSWNCKLWQASYTHGTKDAEKNLHHAEYTEPEKNMKGVTFNCRRMGRDLDNYNQFFGDGKYRWTIRCATGKQLNGGIQPSPTERLSNDDEIFEVYRYYSQYPDEFTKGGNNPEITEQGNNQGDDPGDNPGDDPGDNPGDDPGDDPNIDLNESHALQAPVVGCAVGKNGLFYANRSDAVTYGGGVVAIVACLNNEKCVEDNTEYNGLAMAEDHTTAQKWCTKSVDCAEAFISWDDDELLDGLETTTYMAVNGCEAGHDHPAAKACWDYDEVLSDAAKAKYSFSHWFLPSAGQWLLVCRSFGLNIGPETTPTNYISKLDPVISLLESKGWTWTGVFDRDLWTCNLGNKNSNAFVGGFYMRSDNDGNPYSWYQIQEREAVPFMAFKYNGGAK